MTLPTGHHIAPNRQEMIGKRFGRLTVLEYAGKTPRRIMIYLCRCDCGVVKTISGDSLRRGLTKSCGCLNREKPTGKDSTNYSHGMAESATYQSWSNMIQRCTNNKNHKYPNYGNRGIRICERWMSFKEFFADMGIRPNGTTLGRINNDGDYEPSNCRWETPGQQANNKRNNHRLIVDGRSMTMREAANYCGLKYCTFQMRLRRNWSLERALSK